MRYTHPTSGRSLIVTITPHGHGARRNYTYRLLDGVPGRQRSEPYPYYLDCLKAALDAARRACLEPVH